MGLLPLPHIAGYANIDVLTSCITSGTFSSSLLNRWFSTNLIPFLVESKVAIDDGFSYPLLSAVCITLMIPISYAPLSLIPNLPFANLPSPQSVCHWIAVDQERFELGGAQRYVQFLRTYPTNSTSISIAHT